MSLGTTLTAENEVQWSLVEAVRRVIQGRWLLLSTTLLGVGLAVGYALLAKPYYVAQAVFLPPKNTDVLSSTQASLFGGDESDVYLGMLASRTVQDDVVDHLGLIAVYKVQKRGDARNLLAAASNFGLSKNTMVSVSVKGKDPKLAARIANTYLDALYRLNGQMVSTAAAHRASFFDAQLQQQKEALSNAELALKSTQEKTGVVLPTSEAQAGLSAVAQLQSQLDAAEARLAGLLVAGTDQNPQVVQARTLVSQLRAQLARQQASGGTGHNAGLTPSGRLPELTYETIEREREVKLREELYDTLVQQYERARLSSIDPGPQLQIVDYAVPPERKAGPSRKLIVVVGFLLGFLSGLLYLLLGTPLKRLAVAVRQPSDGGRS